MTLEFAALTLVVLAAVYLVGLGVASFVAPARTAHFLDAFASSARAHLIEISIRLLVGAALVVAAPRLLFADVFLVFGWVIVVTSIVLLVLPWSWHQRFAKVVVSPLTRRVWLFGLLSFPLGVVMLFAALR